MKLGIIVCPRCRTTKVVDLSFKTTTCFRCNKKINLMKVRIIYRSNSEEEIRKAIGLLNKKLDK